MNKMAFGSDACLEVHNVNFTHSELESCIQPGWFAIRMALSNSLASDSRAAVYNRIEL